MWFEQVLHRQRSRYGPVTALRDRRRAVDWHTLERDAYALAALLRDRAPAGARVLLVSANRVEVVEAHLACALSGTIAVPVNPALTDRELAWIVESVAPVLALADEAGRRRLAQRYPALASVAIESVADLPERPGRPERPAGPDDTVLVLHTSATSGNPKGVRASARYFQVNALAWIAETRLGPGDTVLHAGPLFHGSAVLVHTYLAAGGTVCLLDQFTPQGCLDAAEQWRVDTLFGVPSMLRLILDSKRLATTDLSALRAVITGGAPLPDKLAEDVAAGLGAPLRNAYGITEAGGVVATRGPADRPAPSPVPGATCVGLPLPGVSVRIAGEAGEQLPPDGIGTVHMRSGGLMQGYWNNPDATAAALRDGWLNTGDLGFLDDAGYLWLVDRRTDLIVRGGQNVYPAEIEQVLSGSPAVRAVAVVAAPSDVWGQVPVAFVEASTFDQAGLIRLCTRDLASYKRPARFVAVDALPRNASGKLLRRVLRERAAELVGRG